MNFKEKILDDKRTADATLALLDKYPDLSEYNGRWHNYLQSAEVNKLTKGFEVSYVASCGCCSDAIMYAMPYVIENDIKVYTKPAQIIIGEKNSYGTGISKYELWANKAREYGISEQIISVVNKWLSDNHPVNDEDYDE